MSYCSNLIYLKMLYTVLQKHEQKVFLVLKTAECISHFSFSLFPFLHSNTCDKYKAQQNPNHFLLGSFFSLYTHSPLPTTHTNTAFQPRVQLFETSCSGWSVALGIFRLLCLNVWHGFETAVGQGWEAISSAWFPQPGGQQEESESSWLEIKTGRSLANYCHGWNKLYLGKIIIHSQYKGRAPSPWPTTAPQLCHGLFPGLGHKKQNHFCRLISHCTNL